MNNVPDWWQFVLLGLAAWRVFRLVAEDDILDRPRRKLLRLDPEWKQGQQTNPEYRFKWAEFITCPYCAGFWISVLWWIAWLVWPHATVLFAVPWALSAVVALTAVNLDSKD